MSIADLKKTAEHKMQRSLESLRADLAKVRTGRAHTGLLDHVQVEYYGSMVAINTVANITLIDPRTLGVQAWEKAMAPKIEKAIRDSDLGLNPAAQGELSRVPMPAPPAWPPMCSNSLPLPSRKASAPTARPPWARPWP